MRTEKYICGDSLKELAHLPDDSIDAIVTDPPYGLRFMNKAWDYQVPGPDLWRECLRVLKPGGHLLAFAGTRTQHRMAISIEDGGFEIRDMIAWVYGSGFPKSCDVAKQIDMLDAAKVRRSRKLRFTEWIRSTGLTSARINEITNTDMGGHFTTAKQQPAVATRELFDMLTPFIDADIPEWVEDLVTARTVESENMKARKVIGKKSGVNTKEQKIAAAVSAQGMDKSTTHEFDVTAPKSPEALAWDGWGTALKPCLEPITVARKPFRGTIAANLVEHGVGALNIDGNRIQGDDVPEGRTRHGGGIPGNGSSYELKDSNGSMPAGRWPTNLVHDGSPEATDPFPNGSGETAARFFYCAKASKADRIESTGTTSNAHPTVKPVALMRYLVRLVTPRGGLVLDPFMGSGSTGKAAALEGMSFVGIDLDQAWVDVARARSSQQGLAL